MRIDFKRYTVPTDYNIQLKFTLKLAIHYDQSPEHMHMNLPSDEILYDELQFLVEARVLNDKRKSYITLQKYQLDHAHGTRHAPYRSSIPLSKNEYLEFLVQMSHQLDQDKDYLNSVFSSGI